MCGKARLAGWSAVNRPERTIWQHDLPVIMMGAKDSICDERNAV
jgi:hypothetical protein